MHISEWVLKVTTKTSKEESAQDAINNPQLEDRKNIEINSKLFQDPIRKVHFYFIIYEWENQ